MKTKKVFAALFASFRVNFSFMVDLKLRQGQTLILNKTFPEFFSEALKKIAARAN